MKASDINGETLTDMEHRARKAGERAPGRWKLWGMGVMADPTGTSDVERATHVAMTSCTDENGRARTFIASHIATFDPPAALALCAAVRERDMTIERLRAAMALQADRLNDPSNFDAEDIATVLRALATVPS